MLVEVELIGFTEDRQLVWQDAIPKKRWWQSDKPAGYKHVHSFTIYSAEELEAGVIFDIKVRVEDRKVYYKPYVRLYYADGRTSITNFEEYDDAEKYADDMSKHITRKIEFKHAIKGIKLPKRDA